MKTIISKIHFLLLFLFSSIFITTNLYALSPPEDFYNQTSVNITGNIKTIGNTVLKSAYPDSTKANHDLELSYVDVDSDDTTFNSSSATINSTQDSVDISGAKIIWAGLYWQGYLHSDDDDPGIDKVYDISNENSTATTQIENILDTHSVLLKKGTAPAISITADKISWDNYLNSTYYASYKYSAFADITAQLQNANPADTYTLANIPTREGRTLSGNTYDGLGNYGAWALVIIYDNHNVPEEKYRNITVFNGYVVLSAAKNPEETILLSGFMTPRDAPTGVKSTLSFFAGEGDRNILGDYAQLINQDGYVYDLPNPPGTDSYFSSYIEGVPDRDPIIINNNGIDIHTTQVGTSEGTQMPIKTNQTSASIKVGTNSDTFMPSMIAFSTELYVPQFCYDYAYKQDGIYFTEENDGTKDPRVVGDNLSDSDITVGIYIRNFIDSDIAVTDMTVNVLGIDTAQAAYQKETTKVAKVGDLTAKYIPDSTLSVNDAYIKNIDIGTIQTNDYFYTYYNLEPKKSTIDMPINIEVDYNLTLSGVTTPYTLKLGSNIDMCSGSNFEYTPVTGIFNIVHADYYNSTTSYYNLPTQVVRREGNFKLIATNPDNHDELKSLSTIVAVEMIDVSGFHDIDPSCKEMDSTISDRVWMIFEHNVSSVAFDKTAIETAIANNMTELTDSSDFYQNARENAAFRISYNLTNDGNNSLVNVQPGSKENTYKINFTELVQTLGECAKDMDGKPNNTDTVATWCANNSDKLTKDDLATCMECIYGFNTKTVCSRDNFSIRPEAFLINIDDQNQTDISSQARLTTNYSGVTTPSPNVLNLSAGYNYNIEVNATNYLNNAASSGYIRSFNSSTPYDKATYIWEPRSSITADACNDEVDKNITIGFEDGKADTNTSVSQVGEYRLSILDTTWTTVDNNPLYMQHHKGAYFLDYNTPDCLPNSTVVRSNTPYPTSNILNGCNISSSHTNNNANLTYNDINITFHPYKFVMNSIIPSFGLANNTTFDANSSLYMADMSFNNDQDENMSYHLNGTIKAAGFKDNTLSNFVSSCYAKPLDLNISKSDTALTDINGDPVIYQAKFHNLDVNGTIITADNIDVNETDHLTPIQIQVPEESFTKILNGSLNTRLNLNYKRAKNIAVNPKQIIYNDYKIECTNATDCTFSADLNSTNKTKGNLDLNNTLKYYYGRTNVKRQLYTGTTGIAPIFYEVFCSGSGCNMDLLQNGSASAYSNDPRWFINTNHTASLGNAGTITQRYSTPALVKSSNENTGNHPDSTKLTYDGGRGYPYKTTMENNASSWLIYNRYDPNDTTNEFDVEFQSSSSSWSGMHETNASTGSGGASRTNRRSMW